MFELLRQWREMNRMIAATEGEWQYCKRCDRLTQSWFRTVVRNVKVMGTWKSERQRRPICSKCLEWRPGV